MALVTASATSRPVEPPTFPHRLFAAEARAWADKIGLPPLSDDDAVEVGFALAWLGDNPDLRIECAEKAGVPYKVTTSSTTKNGFTEIRRAVAIIQTPEPETPAVPKTEAKRDYGKARTERVTFRVSSEEREELDHAAREAGIAPAEYLRRVLRNDTQADRAWRGEPVDKDWLAEATAKVEGLKQRGLRRRKG